MNPITLKKYVYGQPWGITREALVKMQSMQRIIDAETIQFELPQPQNEPESINGVSVIDIRGTISKRLNLFDALFGDVTTTTQIQTQLDAAMENDDRAVMLRVDSPGGTVSGVPELASRINAIKESSDKTLIAFADGMMASAAYWLGSQADIVFASEGSGVGSIGVIAAVMDSTRMLTNEGIDTHIFTSADAKVAEPMREAAARDIQAQVMKFHSMFIDAVARGRGVTAEAAQTMSADGRVFIGTDAVDAGLVDDIATFDEVISRFGASA